MSHDDPDKLVALRREPTTSLARIACQGAECRPSSAMVRVAESWEPYSRIRSSTGHPKARSHRRSLSRLTLSVRPLSTFDNVGWSVRQILAACTWLILRSAMVSAITAISAARAPACAFPAFAPACESDAVIVAGTPGLQWFTVTGTRSRRNQYMVYFSYPSTRCRHPEVTEYNLLGVRAGPLPALDLEARCDAGRQNPAGARTPGPFAAAPEGEARVGREPPGRSPCAARRPIRYPGRCRFRIDRRRRGPQILPAARGGPVLPALRRPSARQ